MSEVREAERGGAERYHASDQMGLKEQEITKKEGEALHRKGAVYEKVVANWFGMEWDAKVLKDLLVDQDDVGGIEVRGTSLPCACGNKEGCLRLNRSGTKENGVYLLVIKRDIITYDIVGWAFGRDGLKQKYWGPHYHRKIKGWSQYCYGIPRGDINPDENIVREVVLSCLKKKV